MLARILPITLTLVGCTTPQSHSRLRLQRQGSLPDWQKSPWKTVELPWLGDGFAKDDDLAHELRKHIDKELGASELPQVKPLHFVLGRPRVACEPSPPQWRCYAQVIVEMRGRSGKQALWAAEGFAWIDLENPPPPHRRLQLARRLVSAAILSVQEGDQERSIARGSSPIAQAIQRKDPGVVNDWLDELSQPSGLEAKRVALWLAVGHLAQRQHRDRIKDISTRSPREAKARQLALDWLDEVMGPPP